MSLESKSEAALEHLLLAIEAQGAGGCTIGGSVITGVCTILLALMTIHFRCGQSTPRQHTLIRGMDEDCS